MTRSTEHPEWRRSSVCSGGSCVEAARFAGRVLVRDAKNPDQAPLSFREDEWTAFVAGVKKGEFD
jgi:Domain of unknown function (DUF397)